MKKRTLTLHRETLHVLRSATMQRIRGGIWGNMSDADLTCTMCPDGNETEACTVAKSQAPLICP